MCLDIALKTKKPQEGIGYKIYVKTEEDTYSPQFYKDYTVRNISSGHEIGKTYTDTKKKRLQTEFSTRTYYSKTYSKTYRTGYHFWEKQLDAIKYLYPEDHEVIVKIKFSNTVAHGLQRGCNVIVAKTITLLEEVPCKQK